MKIYYIDSHESFNKYFPVLDVVSAIDSVPKTHLIGLDCEMICKQNYPESFEKITWVKNKTDVVVCTIQIAVEDICFFIELKGLGPDLPPNLIKIFKNDMWTKVGVGVTRDLDYISNNFLIGTCGGGIDILNICLISKFPNANLANLAKHFVGMELDKTVQIGDWTQDQTDKSIEYGCKDAIASYKVFMKIMEPSINFISSFSTKSTIETVPSAKPEPAKTVAKSLSNEDYISRINIHMTTNNLSRPNVNIVAFSDGFKCTVKYNGKIKTGIGKSKKDAKHKAFQELFNNL